MPKAKALFLESSDPLLPLGTGPCRATLLPSVTSRNPHPGTTVNHFTVYKDPIQSQVLTEWNEVWTSSKSTGVLR